jgi:hypothetical protein
MIIGPLPTNVIKKVPLNTQRPFMSLHLERVIMTVEIHIKQKLF